MPKFIGEVGVKRLWNKISEQFVQKEVGKGLSENNFSDEYKTELDNLISGTTAQQAKEIAENAVEIAEQAVLISDNSNSLAQDAIEIAQSVRADANNGVFNGQDGADYIITEADKEEIKADVVEELTRSSTALPEMLAVNTIYDLGEQDALTLNLPSGKLGDFIEVDFLSTQTPTTLTITASAGMSDYDLIPEANTIYSLYFNWIRLDAETYGWGFGYAEYTRTVTE